METRAEANSDISERLCSLMECEDSLERNRAFETASAMLEMELCPDRMEDIARLCSLISWLDSSRREPELRSFEASDSWLAKEECSEEPERDSKEARADNSETALS